MPILNKPPLNGELITGDEYSGISATDIFKNQLCVLNSENTSADKIEQGAYIDLLPIENNQSSKYVLGRGFPFTKQLDDDRLLLLDITVDGNYFKRGTPYLRGRILTNNQFSNEFFKEPFHNMDVSNAVKLVDMPNFTSMFIDDSIECMTQIVHVPQFLDVSDNTTKEMIFFCINDDYGLYAIEIIDSTQLKFIGKFQFAFDNTVQVSGCNKTNLLVYTTIVSYTSCYVKVASVDLSNGLTSFTVPSGKKEMIDFTSGLSATDAIGLNRSLAQIPYYIVPTPSAPAVAYYVAFMPVGDIPANAMALYLCFYSLPIYIDISNQTFYIDSTSDSPTFKQRIILQRPNFNVICQYYKNNFYVTFSGINTLTYYKFSHTNSKTPTFALALTKNINNFRETSVQYQLRAVDFSHNQSIAIFENYAGIYPNADFITVFYPDSKDSGSSSGGIVNPICNDRLKGSSYENCNEIFISSNMASIFIGGYRRYTGEEIPLESDDPFQNGTAPAIECYSYILPASIYPYINTLEEKNVMPSKDNYQANDIATLIFPKKK